MIDVARVVEEALPAEVRTELMGRVRATGPFRLYVEAPIAEGVGAGLVRRHDALVGWMRQVVSRGEMPTMAEASARTNLFRRTLVERGQALLPGFEWLATWSPYVDAARALSGLPDIEPTMLYLNLMLPGQELPVHTDTPEFVGLDKQQVPEWLLVAMHLSGLFAEHRVVLAGGVTFLGEVEGGELLVWSDGAEAPPHAHRPIPGRAVLFDADQLFHGVARVGGPDAAAPPVTPEHTVVSTEDGWEVRAGDDLVHRYGQEEVRISMQWKARCTDAGPAPTPLTLDDVLRRLAEALQARGVPCDPEQPDAAFGMALIEEYVHIPPVAMGRTVS